MSYELKAKRAPGLFFQLILVLSRVFSSCYARYRTNTCNKGVDVDLVVCVCVCVRGRYAPVAVTARVTFLSV